MRVRVYFNLHKKKLSVQHKTAKGWRLWKHEESVGLENVCFKVSEAGRQRVLREKKKNVHAFVKGDFVQLLPEHLKLPKVWVSYNPYREVGKFYEVATEKPIDKARSAVIIGRQIFAQI
jgi:hypothetical protein